MVLNFRGFGRPGAPSNIRTLKGSPSLARYFLISETKHQWNKSRKRILPVQASCCMYYQRLAGGGYVFSSRLGGQQLYRGGRPDHTPGCMCTKQQSETTPSCLQAWCLLLFLTNKCPLWRFPPGPLEQGTFVCIESLLTAQAAILSPQ